MNDMADGSDNKFVSRFVTLLFMVAAFAGCAAMLSSGERQLLADVGSPTLAEQLSE